MSYYIQTYLYSITHHTFCLRAAPRGERECARVDCTVYSAGRAGSRDGVSVELWVFVVSRAVCCVAGVAGVAGVGRGQHGRALRQLHTQEAGVERAAVPARCSAVLCAALACVWRTDRRGRAREVRAAGEAPGTHLLRGLCSSAGRVGHAAGAGAGGGHPLRARAETGATTERPRGLELRAAMEEVSLGLWCPGAYSTYWSTNTDRAACCRPRPEPADTARATSSPPACCVTQV